MRKGWKVLTVRGIDIRLHITFPLILLWAAFQFGAIGGSLSSALFGVVAVSLLFVLVTLHELGHSFAALHYGVPVRQIVLTPIGGMAQLSNIPDKPVQEFVIAVAGPAVNVVIAILMGVTAVLFNLPIRNPLTVISGAVGFGATAIFSYVFIYNIFLALFNLLPAFPMDGGRILRSLLALRLDYVQATRIAAAIGQGVAVLMGLYGLFNGGVFLALIAVFIFFAARQEAGAAAERSLLRGYTAQQAYSTSAHYLSPYTSLERTANLMLFSGQKDFPVCQDGRLIGFLPQARLMGALQQQGGHTWAVTAMDRDTRPVAPLTPLSEVQQRFLQEGVSALPVATGDGRYLGLISQRGLADFRRLLQNAPDIAPSVGSARF